MELIAETPILQTCASCKKEKSIDEFWRQRSKVSGVQSECKTCMRRRNSEWHSKNREAVNQRCRKAGNARRAGNQAAAIFKACKDRARKYGLEFAITIEDIAIPELCPVLGIKLQNNLGLGRGSGLVVKDAAASIDRIDNSKGYVRGNIVIVSYRANRIKSDANIAEMLAIARYYEGLSNGNK